MANSEAKRTVDSDFERRLAALIDRNIGYYDSLTLEVALRRQLKRFITIVDDDTENFERAMKERVDG